MTKWAATPQDPIIIRYEDGTVATVTRSMLAFNMAGQCIAMGRFNFLTRRYEDRVCEVIKDAVVEKWLGSGVR